MKVFKVTFNPRTLSDSLRTSFFSDSTFTFNGSIVVLNEASDSLIYAAIALILCSCCSQLSSGSFRGPNPAEDSLTKDADDIISS